MNYIINFCLTAGVLFVPTPKRRTRKRTLRLDKLRSNEHFCHCTAINCAEIRRLQQSSEIQALHALHKSGIQKNHSPVALVNFTSQWQTIGSCVSYRINKSSQYQKVQRRLDLSELEPLTHLGVNKLAVSLLGYCIKNFVDTRLGNSFTVLTKVVLKRSNQFIKDQLALHQIVIFYVFLNNFRHTSDHQKRSQHFCERLMDSR